MESYKKLSIQVSLNGLSFCVLDTVNNRIVDHKRISFKSEQTPYLILKELKGLFEEHRIIGQNFSKVCLVHQNKNFSLVPKALFSKAELANYLKFNSKISASDEVVYDEITSHDIVNVYVPFQNINKYIQQLFGDFESIHNTTVFLKRFLTNTISLQNNCIVNVSSKEMEFMVTSQKKFELYNKFDFTTKEDFLYYLLFTFEQLGISQENVAIKILGDISKNNPNFLYLIDYFEHVEIINTLHKSHHFELPVDGSFEFALLNTF